MKPVLVSVIVLNYNGIRHLPLVLRSLENQTMSRDNYEIIFADNGSSDGSVEYVSKEFPHIRSVVFSTNHGFAEGNNLAARQAAGTLLAFLNNDTEADRNWLAELVLAYNNKPGGIYGSQAYQFDHRDVSANSVTKLMAWGIPTNINVYKPRTDIPNLSQESMYADAAGMLIEKQLFFDLNGFDRTYFAYEEEKDLGWKAWLRGYPSYVVPSSIYYHKGGATLGQSSFQAVYLLWRNGLRNILKYPSASSLWYMLPLHLAYSLSVYVLIFIPKKRWSLGWAICKAYISAFTDLGRLITVRKQIQRTRIFHDSYLRKINLLYGPMASIKYSIEFLRRTRS